MPLHPETPPRLLAPRLLAACLLAAGLLAASGAALPAAAQTMTMESREAAYLDTYRSVAAYERCRKGSLTADQHAAIARHAERQGGSGIGTKRLLLIQQAKQDIRAAGCNSAQAAQALARFDREVAPAIP